MCVCACVFYRTHYNHLWVWVYHLLPAHVPISPSEWRGGWGGIQMLRCVWHWETGAGRSCGGQNSLQFTSRFLQQVARVVWCGDISPAWSRIQGVRTCSGWQALQKHRRAADWWEYQRLSFDYDWFGCNLVHESLFLLRARSVWWAARGWWGIHPQVWHQKMAVSTSVIPHWHKQPKKRRTNSSEYPRGDVCFHPSVTYQVAWRRKRFDALDF